MIVTLASFYTQVQRRGDRLVAKEHICRQCRFEGNGVAIFASELLLADDVDGPPGTRIPLSVRKRLFLLRKPQLPLSWPRCCSTESSLCVVDDDPPHPGLMFQRTVDRISEILSTRVSTGRTFTAGSPEVGTKLFCRMSPALELPDMLVNAEVDELKCPSLLITAKIIWCQAVCSSGNAPLPRVAYPYVHVHALVRLLAASGGDAPAGGVEGTLFLSTEHSRGSPDNCVVRRPVPVTLSPP